MRLLGFMALIGLTALLAACSKLPTGNEPGNEPAPGLFPVTPVDQGGQYTFDLYPVVFAIAIAVFILVEGLLLWIVFRYRRHATDTELPKQTHGNIALEIIWTLIPAVIVTALFIATVNTLNKVEALSPNPDVTIDVTGFQWQWTFEYPDQHLKFTGTGRDGPVMALPVNETIHIRLHAADVIHSFYVPQFLYKKDVIPGRTNEFDVVVQQPGTYAGQCAEFCGIGHADMHFRSEERRVGKECRSRWSPYH
jgi:cytochrome c oxidase, subunit II